MSETYHAVPAEPVKRAPRRGAGRKPAPNPFVGFVREIAGVPGEARDVPFELNAERHETLKSRRARIRRQLTAASQTLESERGIERGTYRIDLNIRENRAVFGEYVANIYDSHAKS